MSVMAAGAARAGRFFCARRRAA